MELLVVSGATKQLAMVAVNVGKWRLMVGFVARKRGQESGSILSSASELLIGLHRITRTAEIYGTPLQSAFEKKETNQKLQNV